MRHVRHVMEGLLIIVFHVQEEQCLMTHSARLLARVENLTAVRSAQTVMRLVRHVMEELLMIVFHVQEEQFLMIRSVRLDALVTNLITVGFVQTVMHHA